MLQAITDNGGISDVAVNLAFIGNNYENFDSDDYSGNFDSGLRGDIKHFMVFDRALSDAELAALHTKLAGSTKICASVIIGTIPLESLWSN